MTLEYQTILTAGSSTLNLSAYPYALEKSHGETRSTTQRRQTSENRWVEGTTLRQAVRENVEEQLAVWVEGDDHAVWDMAVRELEDALDSRTFTIATTTYDDGVATVVETWTCFAADHTLTTSQEYRYSTLGLVKSNVPRLPTVAMVYP